MSGEAAHHVGRVLRAQAGQVYELSDGNRVRLGRVENVTRDEVEFALLEEVPNPLYIASCEALKGWALVRSGKFDEALKQVRRTHEIAGPVRSCFSFYSALVSAETCLEAKSVEEGLAVIATIEATIQQSDIRLRLTELFRIKGELLNLRESAGSSEPELCFREAIEIAWVMKQLHRSHLAVERSNHECRSLQSSAVGQPLRSFYAISDLSSNPDNRGIGPAGTGPAARAANLAP